MKLQATPPSALRYHFGSPLALLPSEGPFYQMVPLSALRAANDCVDEASQNGNRVLAHFPELHWQDRTEVEPSVNPGRRIESQGEETKMDFQLHQMNVPENICQNPDVIWIIRNSHVHNGRSADCIWQEEMSQVITICLALFHGWSLSKLSH